MDKQEKDFIINKGFLLKLNPITFPLLDLTYGSKMSNTNYFIIFGLLWMILYTYLIIKWTKIVSSYYEYFPFKDTFRTLFLISAKIWSVNCWEDSFMDRFFSRKYVEINEYRELENILIFFQKSVIDEAIKMEHFQMNNMRNKCCH